MRDGEDPSLRSRTPRGTPELPAPQAAKSPGLMLARLIVDVFRYMYSYCRPYIMINGKAGSLAERPAE